MFINKLFNILTPSSVPFSMLNAASRQEQEAHGVRAVCPCPDVYKLGLGARCGRRAAGAPVPGPGDSPRAHTQPRPPPTVTAPRGVCPAHATESEAQTATRSFLHAGIHSWTRSASFTCKPPCRSRPCSPWASRPPDLRKVMLELTGVRDDEAS